jgi:protein gp37
VSENTAIEWATHTFNPWRGCTKISPACKFCYAENDMSVKLHHIEWGDHAERVIKAESGWREPLRWNRKAEREGRIARVFCGSLMDICEARDELDDPRTRVFELAEQTPNLFWLFLTKRPENIPSMIPMSWDKCVSGIPQNVAFGATMENQKYADERSAELSKLDCITFASCEPLLGTVDLRRRVRSESEADVDSVGAAFARSVYCRPHPVLFQAVGAMGPRRPNRSATWGHKSRQHRQESCWLPARRPGVEASTGGDDMRKSDGN